jgi:signal peptidase I
MIVWPPSRWRVLPIPGTFGQPGVTSGKPAADAALGPVMVQSAAPLLPLELGFAGAVPLTWLQRRFRLRARGRRGWRRRPGRPGPVR